MLARPSTFNRLAFGCIRAANAGKTVARNGFIGKVPSTTAVCGLHNKVYGINHTDEGSQYLTDHSAVGDHSGRQQNHIWTKDEIDAELKSLYRHQPVTFADKIVNKVVSTRHHR